MTGGPVPGEDDDLTPEERRRRGRRREDNEGPDAIDYVELVDDATGGHDSPGVGGRGGGGRSDGGGSHPGGSTSGSGGGWHGCGGGRGGSGCDCDLPCDLLLRLSVLLHLVAALMPARAGRRPVLALLRFYRRRLTRFTPACPSTPSCSAYALGAVQALGPRRGLAAAARRVRDCGRPRCPVEQEGITAYSRPPARSAGPAGPTG